MAATSRRSLVHHSAEMEREPALLHATLSPSRLASLSDRTFSAICIISASMLIRRTAIRRSLRLLACASIFAAWCAASRDFTALAEESYLAGRSRHDCP